MYTRGKTKQLDVLLFAFYKARLNNSLQLDNSTTTIEEFHIFRYFRMMTPAYNAAFTRANIQTSFCRSGIRSLVRCLLSVPLLRTYKEIETVLSVEKLRALLEERKNIVDDDILRAYTQINPTRHIDITKSEVLTSA